MGRTVDLTFTRENSTIQFPNAVRYKIKMYLRFWLHEESPRGGKKGSQIAPGVAMASLWLQSCCMILQEVIHGFLYER